MRKSILIIFFSINFSIFAMENIIEHDWEVVPDKLQVAASEICKLQAVSIKLFSIVSTFQASSICQAYYPTMNDKEASNLRQETCLQIVSEGKKLYRQAEALNNKYKKRLAMQEVEI